MLAARPLARRGVRISTLSLSPTQRAHDQARADPCLRSTFGKVFKALHHTTNRIVAVKLVPLDNDIDEVEREVTKDPRERREEVTELHCVELTPVLFEAVLPATVFVLLPYVRSCLPISSATLE